MLKNINWNVLVPVVVGTAIVGTLMYFAFKPGGWINKMDGDVDPNE